MDENIRWKQRFSSFERAYTNFMEIREVDLNTLSILEKEGFVQRFEYTFELAWKTLKDYLAENGQEINSPKAVLRQAFQNELITEGEVWMEALKRRNITTHTYNQEVLDETLDFLVNAFVAPLEQMYNYLKED